MWRTFRITPTRFSSGLLSLVVASSLALSACGGGTTTQQPAQKPAEPAKPAAPAPAGQQGAAAKPADSSAAAKPAAGTTGGKEVPIALIAPLSGPWARQGKLMELGAKMAIDEINKAGGVKSLGGAQLVLKTADAGDTAEKAKNAAQRMLSQEKDLVAGTGAWLSSFTLAVTEVTEREQLPFLTLSYSDQITDRGFKYVFQTSPTAGTQAKDALPAILKLAETATGKKPTKIGVITDNTASPVSFLKPMREGAFQQLGLQVLFDETFTPPLSDATPLVQKLRNNRPDLVLFLPTANPDLKLLLEKINEFGLGKGQIPLIGNGAQYGAPEIKQAIGADLLEGLIAIVATWPLKGQEKLVEEFKKQTGEPWMTQDSVATYGDIFIIKEALEKSGSTERAKVADAIRGLNLTSGTAAETFPGKTIKFDEKGRRQGYVIPFYQWQKGEPVTIFPNDVALAQPIWPKQ